MKYEAGSIVEGRVTRVMDFGAFVELPGGESGLVHISEIAHEFVKNVRDFLNEGDIVEVFVLGRDEKGRLDLSIKELMEKPIDPPKPRRLPRQAPEFEHKLKSFMRGSGGGDDSGGNSRRRGRGRKKR